MIKKLLKKKFLTLFFTSLTTIIYSQAPTVTFENFSNEIIASSSTIPSSDALVISIDNIPDDNTTITANIRVFNTGSTSNANKLLQTSFNIDATNSTQGSFYTFVEAAGTNASTIKRTYTFSALVENTGGSGTGGSYVIGNEYDILVRLVNTTSGNVDTNSNSIIPAETMTAVADPVLTEITEINFDEGYTITNETNATHSITTNQLTITTTAEKGSGVHIDLGGTYKYIDATANAYVTIFYKNASTNEQFGFYTSSNGFYNKLTGLTSTTITQSGSIDLSQGGSNAWTGNITNMSLRPRINNNNTAAGNFTIDKIVFHPSATLGIKNYGAKKIAVYPNPTSEFISIENRDKDIKTVHIYDVTGKEVKTFNNPVNMNVSNLSKGLYFLKTDTGRLSKFIKE
ncbi:Por secretion system C-terminal sorting domain-containing protein [Lutibacter oricola]|uniref:Por secretion system C-terminal sorting domain-containing protein n=1 Tax=Lutibacter oricola TaxID=762486 RepID=A0A1H3FJR1_9FLAO|nr:T9SS type A sorting domain-containing protein [Lutibacter oricola]SDX90349.1 Por secretion system C-terminal sorting domain-containing protein [Lutibacter oricola]